MSDVTDLLEQQADILFGNIAGWEQSTLQLIGNRIGRIGRMSIADVKSLNNIAAVKQDMDAITKELARITGLNISQIQKIYGDVIAQQHAENQYLYDHRGKKFVPFAESRELQALVRAYAKTTGGTMLNLAKTKALCILDKNGAVKGLQRYYTDVLDKAVMQVATGATDFHTAMRDSIVELGGSGVRVDYGGGITRRLDTVVRQNLLWGAKQASTEYNEMIGEELGCDGIEVDWHSCPRPSHEFMQGKQYALGKARTVNGVRFESADEALERLQDYGCLHYKTPIICGVSEPRYDPRELARLNERNAKTYDIGGKTVTGYEATQQMRRLETAVRREKDIRETARASGDALQVRRCNAKIKVYQDKYKEISDITGIAQEPKRMSIPRTPKKVTDGLKNGGNSGIISTEREDSPRKQKSGDFAVNWPKIQTDEYRTRLSKFIDNDKALSAVETRAKWALNNRDGVETEELYAVNLDDGLEVGNITDQHHRKRIERTPEFTKKLDEADSLGKRILLIHNHPDDLPPSISDINALMKNKNVSGITVGHDGSLYYYTRPEKEIGVADHASKIYKYKEFSEKTAIEKALEELQENFGFVFKKL